MSPNKFDFKNIDPIQKKKILGYIFIGVVTLGFVGYGIYSSDDGSEGQVDDFSNPQAELIEYNNKSDAINRKEQQNYSSDLGSMYEKDSTGSSSNEPYVNFGDLDNQIANATNGSRSNTQNTYTPPNGNTSAGYNSHSTYGDYSMWQSDEPKNNSVGYTNRSVPITKNKKSAEPVYTEIQPQTKPTYQEPVYQNPVIPKGIQNGKQIRAKLLSQGYATKGRSLSFVLLEETKVGDIKVPKGSTITGVSQEQNNRLTVNFSSIKINGRLVPVQMQLLGSDGITGLPIAGSNDPNIGTEAENRGKDELSSQVNRIPVIGRVISGVIQGGSRTADNRIKLSNNTECIIMNYN